MQTKYVSDKLINDTLQQQFGKFNFLLYEKACGVTASTGREQIIHAILLCDYLGLALKHQKIVEENVLNHLLAINEKLAIKMNQESSALNKEIYELMNSSSEKGDLYTLNFLFNAIRSKKLGAVVNKLEQIAQYFYVVQTSYLCDVRNLNFLRHLVAQVQNVEIESLSAEDIERWRVETYVNEFLYNIKN